MTRDNSFILNDGSAIPLVGLGTIGIDGDQGTFEILRTDSKSNFTEWVDIKTFAFTTKDLIFNHSDIIGATSASLKAYYEGDVSVIDYGINWGNNTVEYNNLDSISVYNLDPNTTYYVYYFINTKEGGEYSTSWSIKTKLLTWNAGEFTATSTTSARLSVETNCDAIEGTGFEWKRYDAPNDLTPYKAPCPIVNGTLKYNEPYIYPDNDEIFTCEQNCFCDLDVVFASDVFFVKGTFF